MSAASTPVFVLTKRREIAYFNSGCEKITGWPSADVVGQVCDYANTADPHTIDALSGSLCPPPEVFAGEDASVRGLVHCRNSEPVPRILHYFPLRDASDDVIGVLGVMSPVSQRRDLDDGTPSRKLHLELSANRTRLEKRFAIGSLVCRSDAMERVLRQIQLARTSEFVFLHGERGTGKQHVARLIHLQSPIRQRTFVPLDCRHTSPFELKQVLRRIFADVQDDRSDEDEFPLPLRPGTVYLNHVESLPRDLQQLVTECHRKSSSAASASLKWIAGSEQDLRTSLQSDVYLPDFYYRLSTLVIELPPLRLRGDDLTLLAQALLEDRNRNDPKQVGGFSEEVWERFREYNWPANVDELAAVIDEARSNSGDSTIQVADLPFRFRTGLDAQAVGPPAQSKLTPLEPLLARVEREQIELALAQSRHNKSKAAATLGITRARLYRRMNVLGIEDREGSG